MKTKTSRRSGFYLIEFMIAVAIVGLLAAIAIPNFVRERFARQRNVCIANLKQIEVAKAFFVREKHWATGIAIVMDDLYSDRPICPAGGKYTPGQVGVEPFCSIPEHAIKGSQRIPEVQELTIEDCTLIKINKPGVDVKFALKQVRRFKTAHPELKITGHQVIQSPSAGIMRVTIRHVPKTNAIAAAVLEQPTTPTNHAIPK